MVFMSQPRMYARQVYDVMNDILRKISTLDFQEGLTNNMIKILIN